MVKQVNLSIFVHVDRARAQVVSQFRRDNDVVVSFFGIFNWTVRIFGHLDQLAVKIKLVLNPNAATVQANNANKVIVQLH